MNGMNGWLGRTRWYTLRSITLLVAHAAMVREVIDRGTMPPWFAAPTPCSSSPRRWR